MSRDAFRCTTECSHRTADHLKPGEMLMLRRWAPPDIVRVLVEQFRCLDCGAWLSLGPSNDDTSAVQIEMRAAELAVHPVAGMVGCEPCGDLAHQDDLCLQPQSMHTLNEFLAGYLAREIETHGGAS